MNDAPNAHDATDPGLGSPDDLATRALKIMPAPPVPATDATQRLPVAPPVPPAEATQRMPLAPPADTTTQRLELAPPLPEARSVPASPRRSNVKYWVIGALAVLLLAGTLTYYFMVPTGEAPVASKPEEEAAPPPAVRPYLDKAAQGDPNAMRMLGTMYYNGLNVQQDRKEGIKWYRKAAAAGSVAAKRDLEQLGLGAEDH